MKSRSAYSWWLLALVAFCLQAPAGDAERSEHWDRSVDIVALSAQSKAIAKYETLIKKYRKTEQERGLRMRLLEAQEGATNLEFRIAHGDASLRHRAVDYTKYHASLKSVIGTSTTLIQESPLSDDNTRVYFVRAQAYAELKETAAARKDYEFISKHFPQTPWAIRANLALAGFATDSGLHRVAIDYLKKVEEFPEDSHYPIALYQLAWAYFNLPDVPQATSYIRRHIAYLKEKEARQPEGKLAASEAAALEHSLRDSVLFYVEGLDKGISGYALGDALSTFRKTETGPYLGRMIVEFANLLRSREKEAELGKWQRQILSDETDRPEALDVVITHVDYQLTHKQYEKLVTAAAGFKLLDEKSRGNMRKLESYPKAQALILNAANALLKLIPQQKSAEASETLSRTLAGTYDAFIAIVDESDPRLQQIHYNLGETLFTIRNFDGATGEYNWILKHWSKKSGLKKAEVALKAISSRYQSLDRQGLLAKEVKPQKVSESEKADLDALKPMLGEWIGWIDAYADDFGREPKAFNQFEFEANRVLYVNGQTRAALARMRDDIKEQPDSAIATTAATLVLDTYVFDKQWQLLLDASEAFLDMPKLGDAAFKKRLETLPADASYKLMEVAYQAKDYGQTLDRAARFEKKYPKSALLPDCLYLASRAADQSQKPEQSMHYLSELLRRFPNTEKRSIALLARASMEEAAYDFDAAAVDYTAYLSTKGAEDRDKLTRRLFVVSWLAKKAPALDCDKRSGDLADECDRYEALIALTKGETGYKTSELVKKATSGEKENRALWAAVALNFGGPSIKFHEQLSLTQVLAKNFGDQDPLFQFVLVPVVNVRIPETFSAARASIPKSAALKPSEKVLARRIEYIKSLETAATKLVKLPWARVKIAVLSDVAQAYDDFCAELVKLAPPEGITPEELAEYKKGLQEMLGLFQEKGKTIRSQVKELAAEFPVEVAGGRAPASAPTPIDFDLIKDAVGTPDGDLYRQWAAALKARAWARAGFFFGQIKEKEKYPGATLSLMRAVSLSLSGARPEALGELESSLSDLSSHGRSVVSRVLYSQYAASSASKKAEKFAEKTGDSK